MSLIFRFFVVLFAYGFASLAAAAVLVFGAVSPGAPDLAAQDSAWPVIWFLVLTTSAVICAVAFVPAIVAILITEALSLRSLLLYAIVGGAVGLFSGYSMGFIEHAPQFQWDVPFGTNFELMAAAGIAAGFVYWLFAGRAAGNWRNVPAQDGVPH